METLDSLLKNLYLISGLNMSLFDINGNLLASYPHKKCPFCYALSQNKEALAHNRDSKTYGRYRSFIFRETASMVRRSSDKYQKNKNDKQEIIKNDLLFV